MKEFLDGLKEFGDSWFNARGLLMVWGVAFLALAVYTFATGVVIGGIFAALVGSGTIGAATAFQTMALESADELTPHLSKHPRMWPFEKLEGADSSKTPKGELSFQQRMGHAGAALTLLSIAFLPVSSFFLVLAVPLTVFTGSMYACARIVAGNPEMYPAHWPFIKRSGDSLVYSKETEEYSLASERGALSLDD